MDPLYSRRKTVNEQKNKSYDSWKSRSSLSEIMASYTIADYLMDRARIQDVVTKMVRSICLDGPLEMNR